jgi:IS5 family transposase
MPRFHPRHVERSVRMSRSTLSCLLRPKAYGTRPAGATFGPDRRTQCDQARTSHLKGRAGDAASAILTAVGYHFRLVLAWLRQLMLLILVALLNAHQRQPATKSAS